MANLYFPQNKNDAKRLSKAVANGKLKRIRQGIYTDAPSDAINKLLHDKWYQVVNYLYPTAIASHVTATTLLPVNHVVFITADIIARKKVIINNSLIIEVLPGSVNVLTEPFHPLLSRSAPARYLLENLQISHQDTLSPKALGKLWVEQELCKLLEKYGHSELNTIRDLAREHSTSLFMEREYGILNRLISAILSTQTIGELATARAIAPNEPFDEHRLSTFENLSHYLLRCDLSPCHYQYNTSSWRNLSFYESYFSNYIEGTEFEINEAEKIIFEQTPINNRHQDSHDVLSVFDVVNDHAEMNLSPNTANELFNILQQRHALIMHARPEKKLGQFKQKANKAGNTLFVLPEHVLGTLARALPFYQVLPKGLHRAIFMQFLITECHPFDDGNGRLARIMMNAELVSAQQHKIIVPTVHRDSYLNGLRQASNNNKFRAMTKVFASLQAYTASINWLDYGDAKASLTAHYADKLPDFGLAVFNKQLAKFKLNLPVS